MTSFKIFDGTTLDPINRGETVTFESSNAGLSIVVTDNKLTFTAKTGYVHTQTIAAAVWTIVHNLGKYPSVSIVDSANDEVIGEVNYTNVNQVVVTFSAAFSGKAFLN
jgi:N-acetylneuraminic acid mutarotase